jgi:hypothetical protein
MQDRLAVFPRGEDPHPHYFMGAVYREQHGLWWHFVRTSRANHDLPSSDASYKDCVTHGYALVCRETFNAFRHPVAILKSYDKNPAYAPFTCLHAQPPHATNERKGVVKRSQPVHDCSNNSPVTT